jgi:hypothetical protein
MSPEKRQAQTSVVRMVLPQEGRLNRNQVDGQELLLGPKGPQ